MTLRGVHRRNILLGLFVGLTIGAGLATATQPGSQIPAWESYAFDCTGGGLLGIMCGLLAGDNQQFAAYQQNDENDNDDSTNEE